MSGVHLMLLGNFVSGGGGPEYTISNITYAGQLSNGSDNIGTNSTPGQLVWKPDGSTFYYGMVDGSTDLDRIRQFNVSTNWDLTTASYVGNSTSLFARGGALAFKPDGSKLYVASSDIAKGTLYQYSLTTPWNIATATYDNKSFGWGGAGVTFYARSIFFINDGSTLLASQYASSTGFPTTIATYTLSTAWDISTASFSSSATFPNKVGSAFNYYGTSGYAFSPNGKKVVLTAALRATEGFSGEGASRFYSADLTTAYDLSTATNIQTATIFSSLGLPTVDSTVGLSERHGACCWNDTGTRLYVTKQWNDQGGTTKVGRILQFDIS